MMHALSHRESNGGITQPDLNSTPMLSKASDSADGMPAGRRGLLPAPLAHQLHDIVRRSGGEEARNVVQMDPAAPDDFITRARFGAIGDFAGKHVMVLLLATEVEEMLGRLAGELSLFLEFSKRGVRAMLTPLENPARQSPLGLTTCDKEDSLTSATDHGGAFLQAGLPLMPQIVSRHARRRSVSGGARRCPVS